MGRSRMPQRRPAKGTGSPHERATVGDVCTRDSFVAVSECARSRSVSPCACIAEDRACAYRKLHYVVTCRRCAYATASRYDETQRRRRSNVSVSRSVEQRMAESCSALSVRGAHHRIRGDARVRMAAPHRQAPDVLTSRLATARRSATNGPSDPSDRRPEIPP